MRKPVAVAQKMRVPASLFSEHHNTTFMKHPMPIVRQAESGEREVVKAQWGLVPDWADLSHGWKTFNARSETVKSKPTYREAFKARRCLVPVDGFYERMKIGEEEFRRFYFFEMPESEPFALAGLWESKGEGAATLDSFTIITTTPNETVAPLHPRMPVILHESDYDRWLSEPAEDLLVPYVGSLNCWEVNPGITKMSDDDPACVAPWKDSEPSGLFDLKPG